MLYPNKTDKYGKKCMENMVSYEKGTPKQTIFKPDDFLSPSGVLVNILNT